MAPTEPTAPSPGPDVPEVVEPATAAQAAPEGATIDVRRLALYGLVILGGVAFVLMRAQRRRGGDAGTDYYASHPEAAGAPSAAQVALEALPAELQVILRQYAHATEQRLDVAASNLETLTGELATIRMRLTALEAGQPIEGRTEPFPAPAPGTFSTRDGDDLATGAVDGGALEAVPPMADAVAE